MIVRASRLTDAYIVGIELRSHLRKQCTLREALSSLDGPFDKLTDGYPNWHPAPYPFHGMLKLFLYREVTGLSYRAIAQRQELAVSFGLNCIPDESVLSRTWRKRFDESVQEFIETASHFLVKEIHEGDLSVPDVRPEAEVIALENDGTTCRNKQDDSTEKFTDIDIYRTTRFAREHGFNSFDSGRAENVTYEDTRFFELQTFMGMVRCGTAQGAVRFQYRRGKEYGPHGETHLRTVKQFDQEELLDGFDGATDRLLSVIASEASFRRPVTVALDITTVPYYGDVKTMPMVSGTQDGDKRAFKFATLSIVEWNIPLVLAVEPVPKSSPWDENPPNQIHRVVRRLIQRAKEHVPIEMVLCDREFDSMRVFQTLSNHGVNYLIPKRISSTEREVIERMGEDGQKVAVESASVHVEAGSHSMQFLYAPSTSDEGTTVFATNVSVRPADAEPFCRRYSHLWQIESEYKSIKHDSLAKTSSKDYRVRLFYFVFAVLLYNI